MDADTFKRHHMPYQRRRFSRKMTDGHGRTMHRPAPVGMAGRAVRPSNPSRKTYFKKPEIRSVFSPRPAGQSHPTMVYRARRNLRVP
jgi:hypothetical protein